MAKKKIFQFHDDIDKLKPWIFVDVNVEQRFRYCKDSKRFFELRSSNETDINNNSEAHALFSPNGGIYPYFCRRCYTYNCINHYKHNCIEQDDCKYAPCDHPTNECNPENTNCWCAQLNYPCEKYCSCADKCTRRFTGCKCKGNCNFNGNCKCFNNNRECDPDLCFKCHSDIDDPACRNNSIQRNTRAHILIGESDISGYGAFCAHAVKKGSLLAEYTGEIISVQESENRADFYQAKKCSYLFDLNERENVDAYFYGNEIRFANHSKNGNSYPQIMKVMGEHRIGIYANRDIQPEEEIFFDYGENFLALHPELIETLD